MYNFNNYFKSSTMKLLLLFTYGYSLKDWNDSGLLFREISLYRELLKKDISIKFLTFGSEDDFKYLGFLDEIKVVPVLKYINSKYPKMHFLKSLFLPLKLKNIFRNVDIIKTNQLKGSWIAIIAKILFKKKIIIRGGYEGLSRHILLHENNGLIRYFKYLINYFWIYFYEYIAYQLADYIILTTNLDISFIIKSFKLKKKKKRICQISNFIDTNLFKPLNLKKKDKHILYIGSIRRQKNLFNLINAFQGLDEFFLDIIGWGPIEKKLKEIVKKLKINVNFLGRFPNNKIPEMINQYEILILPSLWEGNPKVLLEAMSCGIACIGSNIPGINNIIEHENNGFICEISAESIQNSILTLYKDKNLREQIGKNARDFVVNNCSLDSIVKKEYSIYQEISKNKG